jgi:hypothetical protein
MPARRLGDLQGEDVDAMSVARDLIIDQLSSTADAPHLATWYAQGHSDALGDRLLMFDNTSAPSWEILRFKPALARDHRFESGLRKRMEQLASFNHPAFPLVRPLKGLGHEDGLAAVSTYSPGLRLTEAMKKPRSAAFAVRLLRQLAPALAALQEHAAGVFHGALDADRIVVTAEGRLTIREHMIGAAIAGLELSAERLWEDFHIVAPATVSVTAFGGATAEFGAQTDVVQMALLVLSLMAGHTVGPDEYPGRIERLLEEIGARCTRRELFFFQSLRYWIERALQLDEYSFETAREASTALADLRDEPDVQDDFTSQTASTLQVPTFSTAVSPVNHDGDIAGATPSEPSTPARPRLVSTISGDPLDASLGAEANEPAQQESPGAEQPEAKNEFPRRRRISRPVVWIGAGAAAVGLLALGEAIFIGRLLFVPDAIAPPAAPAGVESPARIVPPPSLSAVETGVPPAPGSEPTGTSMKAGATAPASLVSTTPQRNGGFRLSSPVELHVLDGERVLGSSGDAPIVASAGRHEFEFVNSAIGYRTSHVVEIKAGQITSVSMTVPNGTLNINAVPWATVWIDGNSFGDTPLGNVSIAPGEHIILFRHPQLGERREKTIVRADRPTRVTVNLQQP